MAGTRNIEAEGALYVVATDRFMSGWGSAPRKSYYAVACNDMNQARDVEMRMSHRSDFKRVRINADLPRTKDGDHLHVVPFEEFTYQPGN